MLNKGSSVFPPPPLSSGSFLSSATWNIFFLRARRLAVPVHCYASPPPPAPVRTPPSTAPEPSTLHYLSAMNAHKHKHTRVTKILFKCAKSANKKHKKYLYILKKIYACFWLSWAASFFCAFSLPNTPTLPFPLRRPLPGSRKDRQKKTKEQKTSERKRTKNKKTKKKKTRPQVEFAYVCSVPLTAECARVVRHTYDCNSAQLLGITAFLLQTKSTPTRPHPPIFPLWQLRASLIDEAGI